MRELAGVKVREENNVEDQNAVQDQEPLNDGGSGKS